MTSELHPFEAFVPENMRCLILGSFPGRDQTRCPPGEEHWFYGTPRNQFWKILELVYGQELKNRKDKQRLFEREGIGITDVIRSCHRTKDSNLDEHLEVLAYNTETIEKILDTHHPKVLFTSRFVEKIFKRFFPNYHNTDILPSPSPRYFRLSLTDKARLYREKIPG